MVPPRIERFGIIEIVEVGRLVEGRPKDVDQRAQHVIVLAAKQQLVEPLVFLGKALLPLRPHLHPRRDIAQSGQIRLADHGDGLADQPRFENAADFAQFLDVAQRVLQAIGQVVEQRLEREFLDEDTDAAPRLEDAQRFQRFDRLAHRIAPDAQLLGQEGFRRQRVAGLELVGLDIFLEALLHGDMQERGPAQRRHRFQIRHRGPRLSVPAFSGRHRSTPSTLVV